MKGSNYPCNRLFTICNQFEIEIERQARDAEKGDISPFSKPLTAAISRDDAEVNTKH